MKKQVTNDFVCRLRTHSWVLDAFQRIHSDENKFFMPHDLEISNQELSYIVKRSEQWRGMNGERRKVSWFETHLAFDNAQVRFCKELGKLVSSLMLFLKVLTTVFGCWHFTDLEAGCYIVYIYMYHCSNSEVCTKCCGPISSNTCCCFMFETFQLLPWLSIKQ